MSEQISWEYQFAANTWVHYEDDVVKFLNNQAPDTEVCVFDIKDWSVEFNLKTMQQNNVDSKFKRGIRCTISMDNGDSFFTWEYMNGRKYRNFPPSALPILEKAYAEINDDDEDDNKKQVEVMIFAQKATVDLSKNLMVMGSSKNLKVRRQESKADEKGAHSPVPEQSSSDLKERSKRVAAAKVNQEATSPKKSAKAKKGKVIDSSDSEDSEVPLPKKPAKKAAKSKKAPVMDSNDSEDSEAVAKKKSVAKKPAKKTEVVTSSDSDENPADKENEEDAKGEEKPDKKLPAKRKLEDVLQEPEDSGDEMADVDLECTQKIGIAHVYSNGKDVYDVMLNQTNTQNNNNKYFVLQVLKDNSGENYSVWFRWGRVGYKGQTSLIPCGSNLQGAIEQFKRKFRDKTSNSFDDRQNFCKVSGKYDMIRVEHSKKRKVEEDVSSKFNGALKPREEIKVESTLEPEIRRFMELICDLKTMEMEIRNMEYDVNKSPLGKITKAQIKAGYEALSLIETYINGNNFGADFNEAVNSYYTRIPHCFGMRAPPSIRTIPQLKNEIDLLETLCGIEIAVASINEEKQKLEQRRVHPLDKQYFSLMWSLDPMTHANDMFKIIEEYLQSTHASTHSNYVMKVKNVFELKQREHSTRVFNADVGNRMLLWHGSRISNWYGILSQGLRIAPPEAPVTGYMFGKGVYFADASSKSANYTYPEPGKPGFLVLAEVALGNINQLIQANERANILPDGKNSVQGIGKSMPDPKQHITMADGLVIPSGRLSVNKVFKRDI
uniref:Poly [ADP-ribose] polymerase n=1 Tax=Ditylenchus dipsaci TaxID=166011 RepID=A0A915ERF8_9BILA